MRQGRFAPAWLIARPIAHRGLHDPGAGIVENTLGACAAAANAGYAIECDLQITRDGEAVLFHDDTLDRVAHASGEVKAHSLAELKRIAIRHTSERIPALAELLALVDGRVPLVIEIKPQWDGGTSLAARAVEVLSSYAGPHCLMSFDPDVIMAVRKLSPGTVRGVISDDALHPYYESISTDMRRELLTLAYLPRVEPHFMSLDFNILPWAPIAALRGLGMPVISWTIRSPAQAALARRHSDQITFEQFRA